jgi:hypothetical protein
LSLSDCISLIPRVLLYKNAFDHILDFNYLRNFDLNVSSSNFTGMEQCFCTSATSVRRNKKFVEHRSVRDIGCESSAEGTVVEKIVYI